MRDKSKRIVEIDGANGSLRLKWISRKAFKIRVGLAEMLLDDGSLLSLIMDTFYSEFMMTG